MCIHLLPNTYLTQFNFLPAASSPPESENIQMPMFHGEYPTASTRVRWVTSVMSDSLQPHGLYPARILCPWDSPGKIIGVVCHSLFQGIFLTQRSNPCPLISSALAGRFFTNNTTSEAPLLCPGVPKVWEPLSTSLPKYWKLGGWYLFQKSFHSKVTQKEEGAYLRRGNWPLTYVLFGSLYARHCSKQCVATCSYNNTVLCNNTVEYKVSPL